MTMPCSATVAELRHNGYDPSDDAFRAALDELLTDPDWYEVGYYYATDGDYHQALADLFAEIYYATDIKSVRKILDEYAFKWASERAAEFVRERDDEV